jgi:hypothetical protein
MFSFETFEELVKLIESSYKECQRFNDSLTKVLGNDSCVMYFEPFDIVCNGVTKILELNGESHEGADWFVYEGIQQIRNGGTEIGYNGEKYSIKTLKDYYDWLVELNKEEV